MKVIARFQIATLLCLFVLLYGELQRTAAAPQDLGKRVGILGSPREMSLKEAIALALGNNPTFRVSKHEIAIRKSELFSRQGLFDPVFDAGGSYISETLPVGSILFGGEDGVLETTFLDGSVGVRQDLPFGASWSARFDVNRSTSSNIFVQLDPEYPTFLGVDFTLPLVRNRPIDQRRLEVRIATKSIGLSQEELQKVALELITAVRVAYWNLIFAREATGVRAEAVNLAQETLERNQRLVNAGQAADIDVIEAQAVYQRRQEELISAYGEVTLSENALKRLILGDSKNQWWSTEIVPIDRTEQGHRDLSVSEARGIANRLRPEFAQIATELEIQRLNSEFLENQSKPSVDLVASFGLHGLAGDERQEINPLSSSNIPLYDRVNTLSNSAGLTELPLPPLGGVPDYLIGGLGRSLNNLGSGDFKAGQIGVRVSFPFRNRLALGELGASRKREQQIEAREDALAQQVESEIRNALQAVQTEQERLEAARAAREASQARLESEERLFKAGETTNFLLLSRQAFYVETRGSEVRAEMDLNIAVARLQQILGNAAATFNIAVISP